MKRRTSTAGSMDMLLDTMCNTFGGVCFIALMVAILSAAVPITETTDSADAELREAVYSKEMARLQQKRDVLKNAIETQSEFVKNASTGVVLKAELAKMVSDISLSEEKIRLHEKKKEEYLDELARMKTATAYSRREYARLRRMLKELEDKVGRPLFDRHRVVRTPQERELPNLRAIDVWIHKHHLYMMDDTRNVEKTETQSENGKKCWTLRLVKGRGVLLNDDFFNKSKVWAELQDRFASGKYVRIFVDSVSFDELCLFRDALISRKSMYNWIVREEDSLYFTEGYDGHVQ